MVIENQTTQYNIVLIYKNSQPNTHIKTIQQYTNTHNTSSTHKNHSHKHNTTHQTQQYKTQHACNTEQHQIYKPRQTSHTGNAANTKYNL